MRKKKKKKNLQGRDSFDKLKAAPPPKHNALYPDLDVSLVLHRVEIIVGLPAGLRLAVDNAIANAGQARRRQSGPTVRRQFPRGCGVRSTTTVSASPKTSATLCSTVRPRVDGMVWVRA